MKEVKCKLYTFDELSDEVRHNMAENKSFEIMASVMESYSSEYECSLEHFEKATGCRALYWEVDYCRHYYRTDTDDIEMGTYDNPICAEDIKGKLLFRWVYRFIRDNREGKYYGKLVPCEVSNRHPNGMRHVKRYSNVIAEPIEGGWCPWTGCCTDCALVEPIVDFFLNYHRGKYSENYTLRDLMGACLGKFFKEWQSEYDYYGDNKDNCVEEELSSRYEGKLFYEDGTEFHGIYEEVA